MVNDGFVSVAGLFKDQEQYPTVEIKIKPFLLKYIDTLEENDNYALVYADTFENARDKLYDEYDCLFASIINCTIE